MRGWLHWAGMLVCGAVLLVSLTGCRDRKHREVRYEVETKEGPGVGPAPAVHSDHCVCSGHRRQYLSHAEVPAILKRMLTQRRGARREEW